MAGRIPLAPPSARLYRDIAVPCVFRIESDQPDVKRKGHDLAARYGLALSIDEEDSALTLALRDDGLELRDAQTRPGRGFRIDLTQIARRGRASANLSRRQPLARAVGRGTMRVVDATAGLGQDALLFAAMGFEVTAIERSGVLAAMLDDALLRAANDPRTSTLLKDRLRVHHGDARNLLFERAFGDVDCAYLDPMFPPKRKATALAKKEIRLVRALVGDDDDAGELLSSARHCVPRVVVKRPTYAPPLAPDVTLSIEGKLVRYDVYVRAG